MEEDKIEGKQTEQQKNDKYRLAMVIGIYLAIVVLLIAIIVMIKGIDEIRTDPIVYGIEKHEYAICSCYDKQGNGFDFNEDGYIPKRDGGLNVPLG